MRRVGIAMLLCSVLLFGCRDKKQTENEASKSVNDTVSTTEMHDTTVVEL